MRIKNLTAVTIPLGVTNVVAMTTNYYPVFASHSTEHFYFAERVWKLVVVRSFLGIERIVVSSSCRNNHVPIVVSSSSKRITDRSSSCALVRSAHLVEKLVIVETLLQL